MDEVFVTIYLILGFLLRIGIPLGITLLVGWGLRRVDARWRQEALEAQAERQIALVNIWLSNPCWRANECPPEKRAQCLAYRQREVPCWEVFRSNGTLSHQCRDCAYRQELPIPIGTPN